MSAERSAARAVARPLVVALALVAALLVPAPLLASPSTAAAVDVGVGSALRGQGAPPGVNPAVYAYSRPRLAPGSAGVHVTELQWRLWYLQAATGFTSTRWVTGRFGSLTRTAVERFQQSAHLPITGAVDARTSALLRRRSDPVMFRACLASARAWCLSKSDLRIRFVENGRASVAQWRPGLPTLPAASPTREGRFSVFARRTTQWSSQFRVWMPWWLQFSGGEGIHYSVDFARYGYGTAAHPRGSHGCANVRDQAWLRARWARTPVGTPVVVVYWTT